MWRFLLFFKDPGFFWCCLGGGGSQIIQWPQQLSLCCVDLVEFLTEHRYSVDIFHMLVESRLSCWGPWEMVHIPLTHMNRLNKTRSAVFCFFFCFLFFVVVLQFSLFLRIGCSRLF